MKTFHELYNAAIENGFKVETYSIVFDRWFDRVDETIIRISNKNAIWFTWSGNVYDGSEPYMMFKGRYNQNNGVTQNTVKKEWGILYDLGLRKFK